MNPRQLADISRGIGSDDDRAVVVWQPAKRPPDGASLDGERTGVRRFISDRGISPNNSQSCGDAERSKIRWTGRGMV